MFEVEVLCVAEEVAGSGVGGRDHLKGIRSMRAPEPPDPLAFAKDADGREALRIAAAGVRSATHESAVAAACVASQSHAARRAELGARLPARQPEGVRRSARARAASAREVLRRFPGGVPPLRAEEDMKVDSKRFRSLELKIKRLETMASTHPLRDDPELRRIVWRRAARRRELHLRADCAESGERCAAPSSATNSKNVCGCCGGWTTCIPTRTWRW